MAKALAKRGILSRWRKRDKDARASKQQENALALDREGDPRGGLQTESYRLADPREVVEEGGVVMGAPGGAPQEGKTVEERRREDRSPGEEREEKLDEAERRAEETRERAEEALDDIER